METENTTQPPTPTPIIEQTPPNKLMILILFFVVIAIVGIGAYVLGVKTQTPQTVQPTPLAVVQPTPTPDLTANWKIYTATTFSFKYPTSLSLEERQKNYFVLLSDPKNPQSVVLSIDARLTSNYANYDNAVSSTEKDLVNSQIKEINNGIKISGEVGPGYGQGQKITIALFKYLQSAVEVETTATDSSQLNIFDQILSTFKFD